MSVFSLPPAQEIERNVATALTEDLGAGDLTAELVSTDAVGHAKVISREAAVICGRIWFERCFVQLDPKIAITWEVDDGDTVAPGALLCSLSGPSRALLTGERSALNFLQLLSGVATRTRQFVELVAGTRAQIVDTRKTLPGLRLAQKYAVLCGGGSNHRIGLYDAILVKENHILAAGSIAAAMRNAQAVAQNHPACKFIEIEVESLNELDQALEAGARMILLDNFDLAMMRQAVQRTGDRAILEASGGVSLETARAIAETGVHRISIGSLTKDVTALDLSMRFTSG